MKILVVFLLVFLALPCIAVDKPLVVYLPLDRGEKVIDLSPHRHEVAVGGVKSVDGKFGKALSFRGLSDWAEIPSNESLNPTSEFSVQCWVYIERRPAGGAWTGLVGKAPFSGGYLLWFEDEDLRPLGLVWVCGVRYNVGSKVKLTEDTWYHLCYTVEPGEMRIYVNGELTGETEIPIMTLGTNENPLRVCGQGGGTGFEGIVDEVVIYSAALSPEEVRQDMERGVTVAGMSSLGALESLWAAIKLR